ncbi:MAG: hypothetical protein RBS37_04770 [Bacteroidales bacterium]|jgi:hypothetical protein|nr:hypothetical protein [Bacteroidales bacterium]
MSNIDETIRKHRGFFDEEEPSEGHLERFRNKLEQRFTARKRINIGPYLLKAAVVTLLVTLSSLYSWEHFIRPESRTMTLSQVSPQYKEVETFYVRQVNMLENEIVGIDFTFDGEHKRMLDEEMKLMDASFRELQKELKANPGDERIINAMIEHYQTKIEVMSYILDQLKQVKSTNHQKDESHEKVSI